MNEAAAVAALLIPFAAAGVALINTGLGRSRSAAHMMLASLCAFATAALVWLLWGFALQGVSGGPARVAMISGKPWSWVAGEPLLLSRPVADDVAAWSVIVAGMFGAGLAAVIPLGAGADRWRLGASCISTALFIGCAYPLFAHWTWGGGWLAQLGANYGIGRGYVDCGGAGVVQASGGLTALAIAWILGPRRGKYTHEGMPAAIPGHNAVLVLTGCFAAWPGWLGLNAAGAMLFSGVSAGRIPLIAVNTTLSAAGAALAVAAITRARFGKADASLIANGWIAGLVAGSGGCAFFLPIAALVVGAIAGALVTFCVELLELRAGIDDPGGAISVHAVGGLWGVLAVGLFAVIPGAAADQWVAQLIGITALLGFMLPVGYGLNWALNRLMPQRVAREGERQGMDLFELGAGAYPDFMTHFDDFTQR